MKNPSRRTFLKLVGVSGAALATGAVGGSATADEGLKINNDNVAMLYDATRCVGCKACMTTCKRVNLDSGNLAYEKAPFDQDGLWDAPDDLSGDTRTLIKLYKASPTKWSYVKHSCMHCQKPSCVSVCPVSAMTRDPINGIVTYDKDICIGCRYCQIACAFSIPRFQWDKALPQIVKCDMCKSTELPRTGTTGCASVCPVDAIHFGKRGDLLAEARRRLAAQPEKYIQYVYGEHELGGLNHLYLAGLPFEKLGLPIVGDQPPAEFSEKIQHTIYKGFIAPVALYGSLCYVAIKNMKQGSSKDRHDASEQQKGDDA
jgi:Fe-S-cluster-containing dehydrogenase component